MTFIPKPHEIYKHFKGNLYQVVTIARHSETGEQLVIYQALYGDFGTYARPLPMFTSEVDHEKYPEVTQRFRFELQGADAERQSREYDETRAAEEYNREANDGCRNDGESELLDASVALVSKDTAKQSGAAPQPIAESQEEPALDPFVLEFLDADSYEQKLNILAGLHHRITNEMITTMAISCDIEVNDGEAEERYEELKNCLLTMEKFECNRLR